MCFPPVLHRVQTKRLRCYWANCAREGLVCKTYLEKGLGRPRIRPRATNYSTWASQSVLFQVCRENGPQYRCSYSTCAAHAESRRANTWVLKSWTLPASITPSGSFARDEREPAHHGLLNMIALAVVKINADGCSMHNMHDLRPRDCCAPVRTRYSTDARWFRRHPRSLHTYSGVLCKLEDTDFSSNLAIWGNSSNILHSARKAHYSLMVRVKSKNFGENRRAKRERERESWI